MTKQYYVEFYNKNHELLDCTTEYDTKNAAIVAAENTSLEFDYGLIVEKAVVGRLDWNLIVNPEKRKR